MVASKLRPPARAYKLNDRFAKGGALSEKVCLWGTGLGITGSLEVKFTSIPAVVCVVGIAATIPTAGNEVLGSIPDRDQVLLSFLPRNSL